MSTPSEFKSHPFPASNGHVAASTTTPVQSLMRERKNNERSSQSTRDVLLRCLDAIINGVVIAPLVVSYFRGTWNLINTYLLPENFGLSATVSLVIGLAITLPINLSQGGLGSLFAERRVLFNIVYRLYIYIYGFAVVNQFRGAWYLLDHLTGVNTLSAGLCVGGSLLVFVPLRAVNNIAGSPMITNVDTLEQPFRVTTRFVVKPGKTWRFVGDVVLTVVVIISTVILTWRGAWQLLDFFIFPSDLTRSTWTSLGIGYAVYITLLVLESPTSCFVGRIKSFYVGMGVEMVFSFVSGMGSVTVWRGLWLMYDVYVLPDRPVTSFWVTHGVGIGGLFVMLAGRSALVTGCGVDGSGVRLGRYLEQVCPKLVQKLISKEHSSPGSASPENVQFQETRL
ncbi:Hypp7799 [Branchiostoma lanceolatum]|uniref:Hypp7799 protein n=1 Tax=Branchiostoma lanceolatum TaxID=7740 RepID=A0A8J9Z4B6_BRALA|nr:Hypp7799 [Branchiostoma lanceolatum]